MKTEQDPGPSIKCVCSKSIFSSMRHSIRDKKSLEHASIELLGEASKGMLAKFAINEITRVTDSKAWVRCAAENV